MSSLPRRLQACGRQNQGFLSRGPPATMELTEGQKSHGLWPTERNLEQTLASLPSRDNSSQSQFHVPSRVGSMSEQTPPSDTHNLTPAPGRTL